MRRLHRRLKRLEARWLLRFTKWFSSGGGVYQTFLATMAVVGLEFAFPAIDRNALYLMAALTVYSAVTQPALAHSGNIAAERADHHAAKLNKRLSRIERDLEEIKKRLF